MSLKNWKDQTSRTQKEMGGFQFIHKKNQTQVAVAKWDFSSPPKNWAFYVHNAEQARRGYPNQKLGITKSQAVKLMKSYMRTH